MTTLLVLAGSNSSRSINRRLARWAASQLDDVRRADVDLNDYEMPIYSPEREEADGLPDRAQAFVRNIASVDGIVLSLAEHYGSYSAAFKNVFDWASRVDGKLFGGKPMLLLATSPGGRGAQTVLEAATTRFPFHGATIAATFSLPFFEKNFSDQEGVTDADLRAAFDEALAAFRAALDEA